RCQMYITHGSARDGHHRVRSAAPRSDVADEPALWQRRRVSRSNRHHVRRYRVVSEALHVCAVGARTPLGLTADATAAAVRAGVTEVADHPFLVDRVAEPLRVSRDSQIDPGFLGPGRLVEMGDAALAGVRTPLEPLRSHAPRLTLYLAFAEERPGWNSERVRMVTQG